MHNWGDEREIIRRDYQHTHASRRELARRISVLCGEDVSEFAIAGQIARMGIAKRSDRRPWHPVEDERLRELIAQYAPVTVARRMHRSENSVVVRAKRLSISRRVRDGWFTKKEVCEILGIDHKWLQRRIDTGQLKARWHNGAKPQNRGSACWHITEKDLKEFIRRYPQDLTARNVDLIMVVDILVGVAS